MIFKWNTEMMVMIWSNVAIPPRMKMVVFDHTASTLHVANVFWVHWPGGVLVTTNDGLVWWWW